MCIRRICTETMYVILRPSGVCTRTTVFYYVCIRRMYMDFVSYSCTRTMFVIMCTSCVWTRTMFVMLCAFGVCTMTMYHILRASGACTRTMYVIMRIYQAYVHGICMLLCVHQAYVQEYAYYSASICVKPKQIAEIRDEMKYAKLAKYNKRRINRPLQHSKTNKDAIDRLNGFPNHDSNITNVLISLFSIL